MNPLVVLAAISLAFSTTIASAQSIATVNQKNAAALETLNEKHISVDFFEHRAEDVLAQLKQETELEFRLDESAADNNLDEETLITFAAQDYRLASVLDEFLHPYQCCWTLRDGTIYIISADESRKIAQQGIMVYDCSELVRKIQPLTITRPEQPIGRSFVRPFDEPRNKRSQGAGGVFSIQENQREHQNEKPSHSGDAEATSSASVAEPIAVESAKDYPQTISAHDQLIRVIRESIDPASWEINGGYARIVYVNDALVVRQIWVNHREIDLLLEQLRAHLKN